MLENFVHLFTMSAFTAISYKQAIMIGVGLLLEYLAIKKNFEPLLLMPIGFGCILTNLPLAGFTNAPAGVMPGGLFYYFYKVGLETEVFPILIFMGLGALTDFGPLIANPWTILMGAAAQFGVFIALLMALALGFNLKEAASIGIIGGADGPTAIYTTVKLAPHLLGPIAVACYSYMSLVPLIQPPIMRALTTKKERAVQMTQLRPVTKTEKILFPIVVAILVSLMFPAVAPIIGILMLGNLFRETGIVERLKNTAANELINIVTIFLASTVGSTMTAENFLTPRTLGIIAMGLVAFAGGTAGGVLLGKLFYVISGGKINPLIGSAGVSAVPMAARVSQKEGQRENPGNFLLMHAMGPNVAGVIGTAVAAGVMIQILGK
jgi:sodium ion-translocating decarboxylase beta subunit